MTLEYYSYSYSYLDICSCPFYDIRTSTCPLEKTVKSTCHIEHNVTSTCPVEHIVTFSWSHLAGLEATSSVTIDWMRLQDLQLAPSSATLA